MSNNNIFKCPNCGGTVINGKCEYCDTDFAGGQASQPMPQAKKSGSSKVLLAVVLIIAILFVGLPVLSAIIGIIDGYSYDTRYESSYIESSKSRQEQRVEAFKQSGVWQYGTYKIGDEIPEGVYLAIHSGTDQYGDFVADISTDKESRNSIIDDSWGHFSKYLKLKAPYYLDISNCLLYDIEKCSIENDPFERSGMFLCGRDVDPGTYELTVDDRYASVYGNSYFYGDYKIYKDITPDAPVMRNSGNFEEGTKITLNEGEYVSLHACKLKKQT